MNKHATLATVNFVNLETSMHDHPAFHTASGLVVATTIMVN